MNNVYPGYPLVLWNLMVLVVKLKLQIVYNIQLKFNVFKQSQVILVFGIKINAMLEFVIMHQIHISIMINALNFYLPVQFNKI